MSVFDLSTDDSDALEEHAQLNISQQNEPEGDFTKGFATSAGNSFVNAGLVQLGKRAMMAGAVAPILYDAASGAITGKENTDSQDWYFKNVVDDLGQGASKYWTPDAAHTNMAGEIVGGVAGGLLNFAAAGFNPAVVGLGAYTDVTADMTHAGVGDKAANAIGVVNAVAAGAGVKLPAAFGSTLMQRLATGAAGNTVFGMAQRGATSEILEADGKEEMAAGYDWLDAKSVAADALMGAAFGGQHHYFGNHAALDIPEHQRKPLQDAVLTLNAEEHANTTTAPGEPATPAAAAAHHAELRNAIDSVMRGEPVNVSHKIHDVDFTPHKVEPVRITEMRGHLSELLHEDGRNHFAQQLLDHQGVEGAYKTHEEARFVVDQFGAGIQKLHGAGVSMDRLSQLRTSFGKPAEAGAVFNQYAGQNAQGADLTALQRAKQSVDSGADAEQTRQETGWFRGPDNKWRFEIDDSQMVITGLSNKSKLSDVKRGSSAVWGLRNLIDHPVLFNAYPFLDEITVSVSKGYGDGGSYTPKYKQIQVGYSKDDGINKDTLLHEIQHAIQEHEGFAEGGTARDFMTPETNELMAKKTAASEKVAAINAKLKTATGEEYQQLLAERSSYVKDAQIDGIDIMESANDQYKRLAGEVEARDTGSRAYMSAEERKANKPYISQGIPDDQVIVRFGGNGQINSVDTKAALRAKLEEVDYFEQMGIYTKEKADKIRGEISSKPQGKAVENEQSTASGDHQDPGYIQGESDLLARLLRASEAVGTDPRTTASLVGAEWTKAASYSDLSLRGGSFVRDGRSPEVIKTESDRLVASAKKNGFFVDNATSADLFRKLSPNTLNAGIEHHAFRMQGDAGDVVLRVTAGGRYGPDETKSPAQYLHRIEEYNKAFPDLQMRVLGVGQRKDGKSFILTAQKFVDGKEFENMDQLHAAMVAHGWESLDRDHEGRLTASRYKNKKTGAIISDVHEGNVLHDNEGNLYPIDVHVEKLPKTIEKSGGSYNQKGGDAFARNIKGDTEAPQGQISLGIDGEKLNAVITLFGTANKSTALHELSHNFLEIYKHLNQFDDTPASVKADYAEMRRLIGADDVGSPLKIEHHERFAQAFEQYTREGKAPTPALKRAFEHFKEWMTAIYQRAADLGAPINDDVRAMFDKMLGKEMEVSHFDPLLKNPEVQNELRRQAKNAGWAEVGGKVIMDEDRNAVGRTQWIPKEEWYTAGMGKPEDLERIVGKAIRGEKLSKKQQATVESMLESPAHDSAREDAQLDSVLGNEVKQTAEEQDAFWDSMMGDLPETGAIAGIMNESPDMHIMQEDGAMVSAKDATTKLQEDMAESEKMPSVYDAAINCFLRNGQ